MIQTKVISLPELLLKIPDFMVYKWNIKLFLLILYCFYNG